MSSTRTFLRHFAEMLLAMALGMLVLGGAGSALLELAGVDVADSPALLFGGMAVTMTVPMVAWMRHRGHGWAPAADMTVAMFAPSIAAIALLAVDVVEDAGALMAAEHVAMVAAMLVAMLLRRGEYLRAH